MLFRSHETDHKARRSLLERVRARRQGLCRLPRDQWQRCISASSAILHSISHSTHAVMSWFPDKNGYAPPRPGLQTFFARFELDPSATSLKLADPEKLCDMKGACLVLLKVHVIHTSLAHRRVLPYRRPLPRPPVRVDLPRRHRPHARVRPREVTRSPDPRLQHHHSDQQPHESYRCVLGRTLRFLRRAVVRS